MEVTGSLYDRIADLEEYKMKVLAKRYFPVADLEKLMFRSHNVEYSSDRLRSRIKELKKIKTKMPWEILDKKEIKKRVKLQSIHFDHVKYLFEKVLGEEYIEENINRGLEGSHSSALKFLKFKEFKKYNEEETLKILEEKARKI